MNGPPPMFAKRCSSAAEWCMRWYAPQPVKLNQKRRIGPRIVHQYVGSLWLKTSDEQAFDERREEEAERIVRGSGRDARHVRRDVVCAMREEPERAPRVLQ